MYILPYICIFTYAYLHIFTYISKSQDKIVYSSYTWIKRTSLKRDKEVLFPREKILFSRLKKKNEQVKTHFK